MPKTAFEHTIARAKAVVEFQKQVVAQGHPPRHLSDVLRGAVVLAAAGLDDAILDSVCSSIPALAKQGRLGDNVSKWIKEKPVETLQCFAEPNPHEALGTLCREHLGVQTFQKTEKIEGLLKGTIGCEPPWELAAEKLTTKRKKWTADEVQKSLNDYIDRRNRIAHDGDRLPSGRAKAIRRDWVQEGIDIVEAVGLATQDIVKTYVRSAPKPRSATTRRRTIKPGPTTGGTSKEAVTK
ncbi:MAG TPA: hypothetical protein VHA57_04550 [Actinomycetota bacterium]|nr:hypothetical protein [Actinomycetota bacterium]